MPPRPPPHTHTITVFSPHSVHVLRPEKQAAVAGETSEIWCTLAECLGWDNIKVGGPVPGGELQQGEGTGGCQALTKMSGYRYTAPAQATSRVKAHLAADLLRLSPEQHRKEHTMHPSAHLHFILLE